jgi:hypothetical protein
MQQQDDYHIDYQFLMAKFLRNKKKQTKDLFEIFIQ